MARPGSGRSVPGGPANLVIGDEVVVTDTLTTVPEDGSVRWTIRSMVERRGIGKDTVASIRLARNLRPWRTDTFKLSTDPDFESKLATSSGSTTIHRIERQCSLSMRTPNARPSTGPNRRCR